MEQDREKPDLTPGEERELRAVLARASGPLAPEAAMARLLARIGTEPQERPVVVSSFPARAPVRRSPWRYAAAVPLAASLAFGIFLGARGSLDFMMPAAITGDVASGDDGQVDDLGGAGDADAYAQESMT